MQRETGELHCPQRAEEPEKKAKPTSPRRVYYRDCNEAWRAGAAPTWKDERGYRPELDGDQDGWACEPYRGRR